VPDLQLLIDTQLYGGWKQLRVMRSLETVADSFELTLTDRWAGQSMPRPLKAGTPCELLLGSQTIVTGYVDEVLPEYDATQHTITVSGRSKAGDLVDCSIAGESGKPMEWSGKTLLQITSELAQRFGIKVYADADVGAPFRKQRLEPGQPIFEFIEQLARIRALRIVSTSSGDLVITRAGASRAPTALVLGENIRRASGQFSSRERFSDYVVLGQQTGLTWAVDTAEASAHSRGTARDKHVTRYRPTVVIAEGTPDAADCQRRAEWQRNTAFGRGQGVVYTVTGWAHRDGPWEPNRLVAVQDAWLGVDDDLLIVSVQLMLDEEGQRTELRVMPPEAFELVPLPEPTADDVGWSQ
jgi:prophage tail gpP-like protein